MQFLSITHEFKFNHFHVELFVSKFIYFPSGECRNPRGNIELLPDRDGIINLIRTHSQFEGETCWEKLVDNYSKFTKTDLIKSHCQKLFPELY